MLPDYGRVIYRYTIAPTMSLLRDDAWAIAQDRHFTNALSFLEPATSTNNVIEVLRR